MAENAQQKQRSEIAGKVQSQIRKIYDADEPLFDCDIDYPELLSEEAFYADAVCIAARKVEFRAKWGRKWKAEFKFRLVSPEEFAGCVLLGYCPLPPKGSSPKSRSSHKLTKWIIVALDKRRIRRQEIVFDAFKGKFFEVLVVPTEVKKGMEETRYSVVSQIVRKKAG